MTRGGRSRPGLSAFGALTFLVAGLGGSGGTWAEAPERSPLPRWRALTEEVAAAAPRPADGVAPVAAVAAASKAASASVHAVARSLRPVARPKGLQKTFAAQPAGLRVQPAGKAARKAGSVCGLPGVEGAAVTRISASVKGCGVAEPVRVTSVEGVALSVPAIMDCATAEALSSWVGKAVVPTIGKRGGGVAKLQVAAHYACRPRNNVKGAKISEHGRGKAIDISGIVLKNGSVLSVLKGWRDARQGPLLKALHKAACGPFGTVLGPAANRYHQDHFHFDTATYRSGSYCR
ncbi:extensin-like domain-containing protein [Frigidibacter sp. ROC022]|uniref:extensin-like domain-containing protein n=1 Tax=Frigidibacter sp. ROC022 TaxID=2971796 RepID=UPI00215AB222|nr:extensin family protein [Frigidibacter sp. ROC022]MCR8722917.1 extensin family protein [Frigidibacter sp. ROC022]